MTQLKTIQHFADREISPNSLRLEEDRSFRQTFFQQMAKEGLFGCFAIPARDYAHALIAIAAADAGVAVTVAVTNMVAETISLYGSKQQKARYLPAIQNGSCIPAAFAITEPDVGCDVSSIQTIAEKKEGSWLLNGEKQLITNADLAGVTLVFAKTDPSAGVKGISAFLVDKETPGFTITKEEKKLGLLTANLVNFTLDDCLLPADHLLGKEGEGFVIAMQALDSGRIGIAAQAVGIAERCFKLSLERAERRKQFGQPIIEQQAIAFLLADMATELEAGRQLLLHSCDIKEQGKRFSKEAAMAKLFCSEMCNRAADLTMQVFGGYGYIKGYLPEKLFRDARATKIYEGTNEMQKLIISRTIRSLNE